MRWRKLGRVWAPSGELPWARSHAYLPTPWWDGERLRITVACLDADRVGRLANLELDPNDPLRVLSVSGEPVLNVGEAGTFDDSGVSPCCFVETDGVRRLYYVGWQRSQGVPYMIFCGRAVDHGDRFERCSRTPLLERSDEEPWIRSATTVLRHGDGLRMWYASALSWIEVDRARVPRYLVRSADSLDGESWVVRPGVVIDFASDDEFGFGRPWTLRDGDRIRMWYSIRSKSHPYRIGYAESSDGETFTRRDGDVGIEASADGWDSQMICFPSIIDVNGRRFMFYNGNHHGATGFGVAELEAD